MLHHESPQSEEPKESSYVDIKSDTDKLSWKEILNLIRIQIFGNRLIDVETTEIGWKLQDFVIDWNNESETIEESTQNTSTKVQVYQWAMQTLTMRRKRQRLSVPEKLHIYKLIVDQNVPLKDVVWNFNISATTVRNIIKNVKNHNSHPEKMHTNTKRNLMSS